MPRRSLLVLSLLFVSAPLIAQTTVCVQPPSGMVNWWPGEGNANDIAGASHGTLEGGVGFTSGTSGEVGRAFSFDGSGGRVRVPSSSRLNPAGSLTIDAWIFPTADIFGHIVVKWGDTDAWTDQRAYSFHTLPGRGLRFAISDAAHQLDAGFQYFDAPSVLTLNDWNFVAAVYDQSTGRRRIYVNGAQVAERTDPPITLTASIADLGIGAQMNAPGTFDLPFQGLIDEVEIYNRALFAAEIQAIFRAGTAGKCKRADVSVTKTGPARAASSTFVDYTITVTNKGPAGAAGVEIADPTPSRLTFVGASGAATGFPPWRIGALPAGASKTIQATYKVTPGPAVLIVNKATAFSDNNAHNEGQATTIVGCPDSAPRPSPVNNARGVPTNGILSWSDVNAAFYDVFLDVAGRGCSKLLGSRTTTSILFAGLQPATTYEWRIDAITPGCRAISSECFTFTTCGESISSDVSPPNDSRDQPTKDFLFWSDVGAASYTVFLDVADKPSNRLGTTTGRGGRDRLFIPYGPLDPGTTYRWRIEASSPGCETKSSEIFSFTTIGKPLLEIRQTREPPPPVIEINPPKPFRGRWFSVTYTLAIKNVGTGDTRGPIKVTFFLKTGLSPLSGLDYFVERARGFTCGSVIPGGRQQECTTNDVLKPGDSRTLEVHLEADLNRVTIEHWGVVSGGESVDGVSGIDEIKILDLRQLDSIPETKPAPMSGRKRKR